ncbi:MAG: hypothetical protein M0Z70_06890 [Nitrospiraceae bacterium]|nr:hypothetical protein [Nitrospiraceae bacterium]
MGRVSSGKDGHGRITVAFSYNPEYIEKVKAIPGHRWHPEGKHWSFPDTNDTLEKILKVFEGEEIHIDPALQAQPSPSVIARGPEAISRYYSNPLFGKEGRGEIF